MGFILYRCGDDTYVVTPEVLSPPVELLRCYGNSIRVRAIQRLRATPEGLALLDRIDTSLYAVVSVDEVEAMFDLA